MAYVGATMKRYLRVIEHVVPTLVPFLNALKVNDPEYYLTARKALEQFHEIRSGLSEDQLNTEITGRFWDDGVITTKLQRPFVDPSRSAAGAST